MYPRRGSIPFTCSTKKRRKAFFFVEQVKPLTVPWFGRH